MLLPQMVIIMVKVNNYNFKEMSKEEILGVLKENPWFVKDVDNEEIQLEVVKQNGYAITYINNPSEDVQLAAVKENGYAIKYINNPCKSVLDYIKLNNK